MDLPNESASGQLQVISLNGQGDKWEVEVKTQQKQSISGKRDLLMADVENSILSRWSLQQRWKLQKLAWHKKAVSPLSITWQEIDDIFPKMSNYFFKIRNSHNILEKPWLSFAVLTAHHRTLHCWHQVANTTSSTVYLMGSIRLSQQVQTSSFTSDCHNGQIRSKSAQKSSNVLWV